MAIKDSLSFGGRFDQFDLTDAETRDGILFALPYLALFSVFLLYPLVKGF